MAPERAAYRTHARAAGALLLPQLLARPGHFMAGLGLRRAGALAGQIMPNRFIKQVLIHFGAENRIGKFDFADLLDYSDR